VSDHRHVLVGTLIAAALIASAPAPAPATPRAMADRMTADDAALRRAPARPEAVDLQRALRTLSRHPGLARDTTRLLAPRLARESRSIVIAIRELRRLAAGWPPHRIRVGPAEPLGRLRGHYRRAQRRFGVGWHVLAAVNFVESQFGRLRNDSVSGAQGPMQFMPATWRAYGMGGDIQDPHDAILGAANMLRADGAPSSYSRALYRYNPSPLYVDAVRRYARLIVTDQRALTFLYLWEVRR
jgi:membrane-bound lytic murein transglycosylase B